MTRRSFLAAAALAPMLWRSSAADDAADLPDRLTGVAAADAGVVREAVVDFMTRHEVPGLSLALAKDGELKVQGTFGFADRKEQQPVRPDHRFRIASISKPITSVAIFKLIEEDRLSLNDRVFADARLLANYLDGPLAGDEENRQRLETITIAHLLEHTCGGWGNRQRDPMFVREALDLDHAGLIRWVLANRPLDHAPGEEYSYSNFGYCLLGRVIEAVTGMSYEGYVQQTLLKPAGVRAIVVGDRELDKRLPDEVRYYGDGDDPYGRAMDVRRMDSHGGWVASASELVRFGVHVDGNGPPADLLEEATLKAMTTPSSANDGYARGWAVNRANNWWHVGSFNGAASILVRTHHGYNWAVLVNTRRRDGDFIRDLDRLPWQVLRAIRTWPSDDLFRRV
ncbi:serine hydrolase domain-containing protein [Maioricimonas rarisocia]|uniref:serine hydrolase domain-containing protein n=1 Tax=Maioricimonas rarisocia TaxID=2528026 RepID=UPI0018D21ED0|nr:serine hydrolase domain-containing protein [Maioricimonas rarisocia]